MLRKSILRSARPAYRAFTTTARSMAEGSTGGTRAGGVAQGDAFSKREKANEDYEIRKRETDKLQALREKLKDQHTQLGDLEKSIDELEKKGQQ